MPHFTIEHSANLDGQADVQGLCDVIHAAAMATGFFELGAVRVRAVSCKHYAVADRLPENAFAHITLRLGKGRSAADKKSIGETIFAAADRHFAALLAKPHFALSFEIVEIDGDMSWKKNAIHPRTRALERK
jgi:5-carboxymethyl-2-hydroxymuconate isomerase